MMDKKFLGLTLIIGGVAAASYATGKFCGFVDGIKATAKLEDYEFAELKKEIANGNFLKIKVKKS